LAAQVVTTTTLTSVTPAAPLFSQEVTLTATVSPALATGAVSFLDGGVLVGVRPLNSNGVAQITTVTQPAGSHSLRAIYAGNVSAGYLSSRSAAMAYMITAVPGGGFAAPASYSTPLAPFSMTIGDFNGDGRADLAVANNNGASVSVFLANPSGTFGAAVNYPAGMEPNYIVTGDFNGDGYTDLAVSSGLGSSVNILLGRGDGTFGPPASYTAAVPGPWPWEISTATACWTRR